MRLYCFDLCSSASVPLVATSKLPHGVYLHFILNWDRWHSRSRPAICLKTQHESRWLRRLPLCWFCSSQVHFLVLQSLVHPSLLTLLCLRFVILCVLEGRWLTYRPSFNDRWDCDLITSMPCKTRSTFHLMSTFKCVQPAASLVRR